MPKTTPIVSWFRSIGQVFSRAVAGNLSPTAIFQWLHSGDATAAGEIVSEGNAMRLVTVYACVRTLAESVASLPLKLMERTDKGHEEATDQNLYYLLSVEANPDMTAYTWKECMTGCLALTGNSYTEIERNPMSGQPVALWPLHPWKTEPKRDPVTRKIFYETSDGMPLNQVRKIDADDILHFKLFSMDGLRGISPVEMCRQTLGLAMAQEKSGSRYFANGSNPGGILMNKNKLDPKAQAEMRESWNNQQGGVNQGKTAFLFGTDWSYQQLGISNEASQWLQSRAFSRADISMGMFRVPPHMVGDTSRLSGNNAEQQSLQFATYTLQPYLSLIEGEIIRKLMPTQGRKANKYFVEFSVDALLRSDFKTQMDGYSAGRIGGWFSANDVRTKMGLNPGGPELDVYLIPVNYQNAKLALTVESIQDQPIDTPAPTPEEQKMLGSYTRGYISLYKVAFQKLLGRNRRDSVAIDNLFRPLLRAISDSALGIEGFPNPAGDSLDGVITDALRSMARRVAKWSEVIPEADVVTYASTEFNKAIRAIHIGAAKELATRRAVAQLEAPIVEPLTPEEEEEYVEVA